MTPAFMSLCSKNVWTTVRYFQYIGSSRPIKEGLEGHSKVPISSQWELMGTFGNRPLLKQEMMISAQIVHERSLWHNPFATSKFAMGTYGNFWEPPSTKAQNDDFSQIVHDRSLWHNPLATGKFAMGTYGNFWEPSSTKDENYNFSTNRARWSSRGELLRTLRSHENIMISCIEFFAIW